MLLSLPGRRWEAAGQAFRHTLGTVPPSDLEADSASGARNVCEASFHLSSIIGWVLVVPPLDTPRPAGWDSALSL